MLSSFESFRTLGVRFLNLAVSLDSSCRVSRSRVWQIARSLDEQTEGLDRRLLKEVPKRQCDAVGSIDAGDGSAGLKRVTAQVQEMIGDAHRIEIQ
jgi:hypothetical protein